MGCPSLLIRDDTSLGCTELHLAGASLTVINAHNGEQKGTVRQGANKQILLPGRASSSCSQTQHCTHPTPPLCPRRGGFTSPSSGSFQELPELIAPNPSTKGSHLVQGLRSSRRRQHNVGEQFLCISGSSRGL